VRGKEARVCVIGAGISGLGAAYYLGKRGYKRVTVLEAEPRVGGKCWTLPYAGKTYEMGSMMAVETYERFMALMRELKVENSGPTLYRDFFSPEGRRVPQVPPEFMEDFKRQFERLSGILGRYDGIKKPGLSGISDELKAPFSDFCEKEGVPLVRLAFAPPFTAFGYGFLDEVPAAYVLKYLDYRTLLHFIEITHLITFVDGMQGFLERLASLLPDLRLGCPALHVERRGDRVEVETPRGRETYDALIVSSALDRAWVYLDSDPDERELFGRIETRRYRCYAYRVRGIPQVSGFLPRNFGRDAEGHLMVWYYRWQEGGLDENRLVTCYAAAPKGEEDGGAARARMEDDLKSLGAEPLSLYMAKEWDFFPHVGTAELRAGFYERLEALQGRRATYYAGEIMNFADLEACLAYSADLVERFF
jgi:phytoene dehydrogenase-like protein